MERTRKSKLKRFIFGLLLVAVFGGVGALRMGIRKAGEPELAEMIRGYLVSFGRDATGMSLPTSAEQIDAHILLLTSRVSEDRVRAAAWLSARGIREAAPAIAAAMRDPTTLRPCQLAKSLGHLGDAQYVPLLSAAATQTGNADLRVCATIALGDLAARGAVPALVDAYERDLVTTTALTSIGLIGDPAALPFLRSVLASPRNDHEGRAALLAIRRIEILQADEPVPLLAALLEEEIGGRLDEWAVRALALSQDPLAVKALKEGLLSLPAGRRRDAALLAAGLLASGAEGHSALLSVATVAGEDAAAAARAALSLRGSRVSPAR